MLKIGIEQEVVFVDDSGQYVDADNSDYRLFADIVKAFPAFEGDDRHLDCKSVETYPKRCYVEGFERHDEAGNRLYTLPKALEIRTLPHASVAGVVAEFRESWRIVTERAASRGLQPVLTSRHPFKNRLDFFDSVGEEERRVRSEARLDLARRAMFTHGLHVNASMTGRSRAHMEDLVDKVCFYTPAITAWSFSSPFYLGRVFEGLCSRNYYRASSRAMVDLNERKGEQVIEFRGFDACGDHRLMDAVLRLFSGLLLDARLPGRARTQDSERLMRASLTGFADPSLRRTCRELLRAACAVLPEDREAFDYLETLMENGDTYAARMKSRYEYTASIRASMTGHYDF